MKLKHPEVIQQPTEHSQPMKLDNQKTKITTQIDKQTNKQKNKQSNRQTKLKHLQKEKHNVKQQ